MTILVSKEEILKQFIDVHGEVFEYDLSNFKNKSTKISICCREHGIFVKTGWKHLQGQGCPACSRTNSAISRSKTHEEFLLDCVEKHGEKYDYSLTKYKGANSLVTIICREHGNFTQKAVSHSVLGYGCMLCGAEVRASKRRITKEQFISRAEALHTICMTTLK